MKQGFKITTSNLLEKNATPEDHKSGLILKAPGTLMPKADGASKGGRSIH